MSTVDIATHNFDASLWTGVAKFSKNHPILGRIIFPIPIFFRTLFEDMVYCPLKTLEKTCNAAMEIFSWLGGKTDTHIWKNITEGFLFSQLSDSPLTALVALIDAVKDSVMVFFCPVTYATNHQIEHRIKSIWTELFEEDIATLNFQANIAKRLELNKLGISSQVLKPLEYSTSNDLEVTEVNVKKFIVSIVYLISKTNPYLLPERKELIESINKTAKYCFDKYTEKKAENNESEKTSFWYFTRKIMVVAESNWDKITFK